MIGHASVDLSGRQPGPQFFVNDSSIHTTPPGREHGFARHTRVHVHSVPTGSNGAAFWPNARRLDGRFLPCVLPSTVPDVW